MIFVLGFRLNDNHLGLQFTFTFGLILPFYLVRILTTKKLKSGSNLKEIKPVKVTTKREANVGQAPPDVKKGFPHSRQVKPDLH